MFARAARPMQGAAPRGLLVAATAFLTLVDLFATQAIAPALAERYGVGPAQMGVAVNAATFGMAAASLLTALFGERADRRRGILVSLALLSVPTALLAFAPNLTVFALLRVVQGLCMATAFTLTLAWLGERAGVASASAFAAYVAGNVASNLLGRLIATGVAGEFGTEASFAVFAVLNLAGAALVWAALDRGPAPDATEDRASPWRAVAGHLTNPPLLAAFGLGFCILFAFIGVFTYVNFVLTGPEIGLAMGSLGLVYLVFAPSIATTSLAGRAATAVGRRQAALLGLVAAGLGLALLLAGWLPAILAGLALVAAGTFFAQAVATGFVGKAARGSRSSASGVYLAFYFAGGLVGAWALGEAFVAWGWEGCVAGVAVALGIGAALTRAMKV